MSSLDTSTRGPRTFAARFTTSSRWSKSRASSRRIVTEASCCARVAKRRPDSGERPAASWSSRDDAKTWAISRSQCRTRRTTSCFGSRGFSTMWIADGRRRRIDSVSRFLVIPPWLDVAFSADSGMIDIVRDKAATITPARPLGSGRSSRRLGPSNGSDRAVAIVVYDGVNAFELGVACETFGDFPPVGGIPWYRLSICAVAPGPIATDGGFLMHAPHGLERLLDVDTVIVPPTDLLEQVPAEVHEALRQAHTRGARIVSFCTGAFVLAEAGLLDGRRATTHWSECAALVTRYPRVVVDPDVLYVDEGDLLTSAGSAAAIDLCLHIVRTDFGADIATQLARELVVSPQRDGGQAQFIDTPMPVLDGANLFVDAVAWLQQHVDEPVTVAQLAARSAMSPRSFARRFVASTGTTPYQWLLRERVLFAQRLLETSDLPIDAVAARSGFGSPGAMRKYFQRAVQTSPHAYRRAFRPNK
jgi:AraC family transcriptional regulator, transcriptional activator FtrA